MITIEIDDQQVRQALTRLADSAENPHSCSEADRRTDSQFNQAAFFHLYRA